jgi:hypothetical protein
MSNLATQILAELDDRALDLLAERLAPRLVSKTDEPSAWLDVTAAAAHLTCPKSRI